MSLGGYDIFDDINLTLTRVVFEFYWVILNDKMYNNLTLTRVVFE